MFLTDWDLARSLGKTYCARKGRKMNIENLIIVALKKNFPEEFPDYANYANLK